MMGWTASLDIFIDKAEYALESIAQMDQFNQEIQEAILNDTNIFRQKRLAAFKEEVNKHFHWQRKSKGID